MMECVFNESSDEIEIVYAYLSIFNIQLTYTNII